MFILNNVIWFIEDYIDDNKCNEWTPEIPFENVSIFKCIHVHQLYYMTY